MEAMRRMLPSRFKASNGSKTKVPRSFLVSCSKGEDLESTEKRALRLDAWLADKKKKYYMEGNSDVSDDAYDAVEAKRKGIHGWKGSVGSPIVESSSKVRVPHVPSMLSLTSVRSESELRAWMTRTASKLSEESVRWTVEPKVDGVALRLKYARGKLVQAATRGDGELGEDVTVSVQRRLYVPIEPDWNEEYINRDVDVRGEAFLYRKDFERINRRRKENGMEPFAHVRNAVAGALRRLDDEHVDGRVGQEEEFLDGQGKPLIQFAAYSLFVDANFGAASQWEVLKELSLLGFRTSPGNIRCDTFEEAIEAANAWMRHRDEVAFDADGVVFKVDDLKVACELGQTSIAPRGSVAWKFAAQETVTTLVDIHFTVGRTGRVVPNAVLEPVELAGARLAHATLHNFKTLKEMDIRIGDQVVVKRAGDVIPQVVQVLYDLRQGNETAIELPMSCPSCGEGLVRLDGEELHRCINGRCPAQIQRKIVHFVDSCVDGVGKQTVQDLLNRHLISDIADLYKLQASQLEGLPGYGARSVGVMLQALEQSKHPPLKTFMAALGIRYVGERVAALIAAHFSTLDAIKAASVEDMALVDGVGHITAKSLWEWVHCPANQVLLEKLLALGFLPCELPHEEIAQEEVQTSRLQGLTIVLTGTLQSLTREEASTMIEERGGITRSSVSKNTDLVVAGRKAGTKLLEAQRLGVRIIGEEDLLQLLDR